MHSLISPRYSSIASIRADDERLFEKFFRKRYLFDVGFDAMHLPIPNASVEKEAIQTYLEQDAP